MLRRTPIFTALDPNLIASGLYLDAHPVLAPLWAAAEKVQFVDGKVRHRKSDKKLLRPAVGTCRGVGQQLLSNGEKVLWFVIENTLYRWDVFSIAIIATLPPSGANSPYVDFTFYGDWAFINRGVGNVQFFNGLTLGTMAEMPTNVRQLQKFLSFLMAVGIGSKKTGVAWSDANNVSKWNPTAINTAGALYFDEFATGIVASSTLGPVLSVYGDSQMGIVSFIGSPFYFGKKTLLSGIGAVGPESVTSVGLMNYGVGRQGPWRTDGQEVQYIDEKKMHDYFQENVNWELGSKIIVSRNDVLRTVEFFLPMNGSSALNEGWSFDPASGGWSKIAPVTYISEDMVFGLPIRVDAQGEIALSGGLDYNRENLILRTKPLVMSIQSAQGPVDVRFDCKVDEIELMLKTAQNVRMRVGSSREHNGTVNWSSYIVLDPLKSSYPVPANVPDGVYWHLEFTSAIVSDQVVQTTQTVTELGNLVVALSDATSWKLNLQGFMLFGAVEGAKGV